MSCRPRTIRAARRARDRDNDETFIDGATFYTSVQPATWERWALVVGLDWRETGHEWTEPRCWVLKSELNARCHREPNYESVSIGDVQFVVGAEYRARRDP